MIVDPPSLPPSNSKLSNNDQLLRLNPGVTHRKPRSACKLCLWLLVIIVVTFGSYAVYLMVTGILNGIRNPHRSMYHDEKGKGAVTDWSQVVKPMIEKNSKFDVVASVWIRDDTLAESGRDASLKIDGEERPEKLVFTEKVFTNVDANSNMKFANVKLRIPTSHFKQANLSNYDLRASFVLVQSDENRPSWLDFAKRFTSWKPQSLEMPSVRKHEADMTLEDKIYDSFGISIPLIEFHNITSKRPSNTNDTLRMEIPAMTMENATQSETDSEVEPDEEPNWDEEETTKSHKSGRKLATHSGRNTHGLEFIGRRRPVTEYHPYVVTRTHLRIMKQDRLFKRIPYTKTQKEVASKICVDSARNPIQNPEWYECRRFFMSSGVFETKVQVQLPPSPEKTETKVGNGWRTEWLYAPYVSAMQRAAGPKDLVPIPVNRENLTQAEISDEEYVTVNWKLTFSSHTAEKFIILDAPVGDGHVHNMTQAEPSLQSAQREHDMTWGFYGHRIDEDAHPRRTVILGVVSQLLRFCCLLLTIHYWYTRTTTTGISRLGTALLCLGLFMDNLEELLVFMFDPENQKSGIWMFPIPHILDLIEPCVMFVAIMRLEFSWSTEKESGRESGKTKKFWIPRVYIAKASHSERASERREARLSKRTKLMIFITTLAAAHFFMTSKSYLISPTIELPEGPRKHALESFSSHIPTIAKHLRTFVLSCFITGRALQFFMNHSSRTYAGGYKMTILLSLASTVAALADLVPSIVGSTLRMEGVTVIGGVLFVMDVVALVQAVKYRYAKDLDGEDEA